jgi:hypothetical protein
MSNSYAPAGVQVSPNVPGTVSDLVEEWMSPGIRRELDRGVTILQLGPLSRPAETAGRTDGLTRLGYMGSDLSPLMSAPARLAGRRTPAAG